ncbi:MFS transporter [Umezawaea tangerina]|uniref:Putative MFS family arabinose efflux permease n=1 Tax=Umezawaea tangerina TaxID=84725 RepID=A0A2T0TLB7_9PSEU|nr:MFS transporter [Umezawaea tangerina]PRY46463.1 putative MFS family arabinose efflux permease [Umezawaea tangerina]
MSGLLRKVAIDTRPLRIAAYRRLWLSTIVTAVGSQLTAVAVPKQVYDLTGSSGWVGIAAAVALVPLLVFGLYGGAVADAVDRRKLLIVTNAGIAATSVLLWLQAAFHVESVWLIIVLLGLQQVFFALNAPARSAVIGRLVPGELMASAAALGSTVMTFGAVLGPMLAGALMPVIGLSTLYLVDAVALTVTIYAVWKLPSMPPLSGQSRRAGFRDVLEGFRYLGLQKLLLASFLLDIIAMVFGMPRALFPEMAENTFGDPPGGGLALGWLFAAVPLGAMVCGLMSGWLTRMDRHGAGVAISVVVWGVAIAGFGLSHSLWLAVLFLALAGAADMVSMVFRSAIMQNAATDEMRGRMQGVFIVVVAGGPRLADLLHGTTGAVAGTGAAVTGGGVLVVVFTVIAVLALPAVWHYRFSPTAEVAEEVGPARSGTAPETG